MTKILVIEDMDALREDLLEALEMLNFETLGAVNGMMGVEMAQQYLPDLVLCDIMMPELDGYGVLEALHQIPATAAIPFIFLSAKADRSDIRLGMNMGADDYLTKPFTINELQAAIAARLAKQAARQQVEASLRSQELQWQQLAQQKDLTNNLSSQISSSLDVNAIINTAASEIRGQLGIHRCRFLWYRNDVLPAYFEIIQEACDSSLEVVPAGDYLEHLAGLEAAVSKQEIFQIDDVSQDPHLELKIRHLLQGLSLASILAAPIQTNSERIGIALCEHFYSARPWSDNEVALIAAVGKRLAIAIDRAELYAQTRFTATTAQIQASQLETALIELQKLFSWGANQKL